jgi:hypothetical protein
MNVVVGGRRCVVFVECGNVRGEIGNGLEASFLGTLKFLNSKINVRKVDMGKARRCE